MSAHKQLAVEYRPVADLIPYARNPRLHSDAQVAQLAASIKEFGWTNPVLLDGSNGIIAGHGRVLAARKLGMDRVPCIELAHLSEAQRRAYVIADNKLALNAGWDDELLRVEFDELRGLDFDLALAGFGEEEIADLFGDDPEPGAGSGAPSGAGSLSAQFGVPPFSVLNAREGWWQDRKRAWLALGIQSELGRGENLSALDGAIERREAIKEGCANATPGGSAMPPASLVDGKTVRGDGRGRKAKAIPGGAMMPLERGYAKG